MSENKELAKAGAQTETAEKPRKSIWNGALKMVRGENTAQLIENFTAEMTLVAEGLCEDQSTLRRDTERMISEDDRRIQKLQSRIDVIETSQEEERKAHDSDLTELRKRLAALEKKANSKPEDSIDIVGILKKIILIIVSLIVFILFIIVFVKIHKWSRIRTVKRNVKYFPPKRDPRLKENQEKQKKEQERKEKQNHKEKKQVENK